MVSLVLEFPNLILESVNVFRLLLLDFLDLVLILVISLFEELGDTDS